MDKLYISPSSISPEINLSPEDNIFIIRGKSAPEDVRALYLPVYEWVNKFVDDLIHFGPRHYSLVYPLVFRTELYYFNSSSAKFLFDIYMELKRLLAVGIPVVIEWVYDEDDPDIREAGSDIATLLDMEFVFVSQNKNE